MKRLISETALQRCHRRRRGALFHYYMMYLLLSSVLLTTAGMSIHAVLKADRIDSVMARDLHSLLRLDGQLRRDTVRSSRCECTPLVLTVPGHDETDIRWTIDGNVARREVISQSTIQSTDRYVFRKGTRLQFEQAEQRVSLTVFNPPVNESDEKNDPGGPASSVQIVMWLDPPSDASGDTSGDDS
ncbi:MAG: hypothetical protein R3C59_26460 [Planctomycetaceae bacterium]